MAGRLDGKVAIVTGAGSIGPGWGNGKAAAALFAREGAKIFAVDLSLDAAVETKAAIDAEGGDCTVHEADVSRRDEVKALVERCVKTYGRIDILHNNVGILDVGGPVETSEESWDRVIRVNLKSMYLTCKFVLPQMVRQFEHEGRGGAIVNIGSIAAIRWIGVPYISYAASKGAAMSFTRAVALEYAGRGVRCNCILPGLMNTPMVHKGLAGAYSGGDVEKMVALRDAQCPTGKMGDAWDVAYAALFLASDEAKYITGVALPVDGGITLKSV
ncbi:MAG: SDR family oxidoreductase [Rhodospirillales bacterium]|nr:SDR family oxidoreductase [Rhodospirillales bacterium]